MAMPVIPIAEQISALHQKAEYIAKEVLSKVQAFENSPVALWEFVPGPGGGLVSINAAYCDIFDLARTKSAAWQEDTWEAAIFEEDRERVIQEWEAAVKAKVSFHCTFRLINQQTGVIRNVRVRGNPVFNGEAEVTAYSGVTEIIE